MSNISVLTLPGEEVSGGSPQEREGSMILSCKRPPF